MAGAKPDPFDLSQDGVDRLQEHFRRYFAGDGTLRGALDSVLGAIADRWNDHSGIEPSSFDTMRNELGAGNRTIGILRLTSSGNGDTTFDGDGYKEHNIAASAEESAWEVAIASGNEPVVTGFSGDRVFLARYSNTGATEFTTRTDVVSNAAVEGTTALGIDGSGRFVVAGWVGPPM